MDIKTTKARLRQAQVVEVPVTGQELLEQPLLNKGTAFSEQERHELGLMGLLPPDIEDIEQQAARCYEAFGQQPYEPGKAHLPAKSAGRERNAVLSADSGPHRRNAADYLHPCRG